MHRQDPHIAAQQERPVCGLADRTLAPRVVAPVGLAQEEWVGQGESGQGGIATSYSRLEVVAKGSVWVQPW